jgi:hypothetical protein
MVARRRNEQVLLTELPDGTGVVVHLDKRCYYPLSRSGVFLWHRFDDGVAIDDRTLVAALVERYRVDESIARRDVHAFVTRLVDEGILTS